MGKKNFTYAWVKGNQRFPGQAGTQQGLAFDLICDAKIKVAPEDWVELRSARQASNLLKNMGWRWERERLSNQDVGSINKATPAQCQGLGQKYQLWFNGELMSEDKNLNRLLRFAKEQISEEAWDIEKDFYKNVLIIRVEIMEFNFEAYMKGTGLKAGKK